MFFGVFKDMQEPETVPAWYPVLFGLDWWIGRSEWSRLGIACECAADGFTHEWNNVAVVVSDGVHTVQFVVGGVIEVLIRLGAGEESPAAVLVV